MSDRPKISVAIPIHDMKNGAGFLGRLLNSLHLQDFQDFEIVITKDGKMAKNTNAAIKKCRGDIVKILYMDDYLAHPRALRHIADHFHGGWLASACVHDAGDGQLFNPHPASFDGILNNSNTIGSPSVIAFENNNPLLFDESMSWLLDVDYYRRLYDRYGPPTILDTPDVVMGVGDHQMTNILTDEQKMEEHIYINEKYGK